MRAWLGQHFLKDQKVIQTIVAAAQLKPTDTALEIGPGKGVLTQALLPSVKRLVAVELDRTLAAGLAARFKGHPVLHVVQGDILKQSIDDLFPPAAQPVTLLGNLPYAITSPIFEKLMPWHGWETAVFLIQREVAERIASLPGSRTFGILSLAVQLFADAEKIATVKPGAFSPPPQVDSAVIRLRRKTSGGLSPEATAAFFDFAHGAFAHRRKTISNSLAMHAKTDRRRTTEWLRQHGIDPLARAEMLGVDEVRRIALPWAIFRRETVS